MPEEQLLLQDIYAQANEPDGLHAVCQMAHGTDPGVQLRLYRQDGAWADVLTASDAMLRHSPLMAPCSSSSSSLCDAATA